MSKNSLIIIIKLMFFALAMSVFFVLMRSLGGPSHVNVTQQVFDDVRSGQTALRRLGGEKVWATRLTPMQRNQLASLQPQLMKPEAGCSLGQTLCVVKAATSRSGIEIIYRREPPPQLKGDTPWFGGYIDPTNGQVFDLLGRAYHRNFLFNVREQNPREALENVPFDADTTNE